MKQIQNISIENPKPSQLGNIVKLKINKLGMNGEGVARLDNKVVFVNFALPDEVVEAEIVAENSSFLTAKLLRVISPSPHRIEPKCPYFSICGGCMLQNLEYAKQLEFKKMLVEETLEKITGHKFHVYNTIASPNQFEYRNKISLNFGFEDGKISLGYHLPKSKEFFKITNCSLFPLGLDRMLEFLCKFANDEHFQVYNPKNNKGIFKGVVLRQLDRKMSITFIVKRPVKINGKKFVEDFKKEQIFNHEISLYMNIDTNKNSTLLTPKNFYIAGQKELETIENGLFLSYSNLSFCQINRGVKNLLYDFVLSELDESEVVVNAYSGAGHLSAILAQKSKQVYGLEMVQKATDNANKMKARNKISNLENINGNCEKTLPPLLHKIKNACIVLDPPRSGIGKNLLKSIVENSDRINKIIYVSCNSISLAKNIKTLLEKFDVETVQPFDMFPQTAKIETVVILTKK